MRILRRSGSPSASQSAAPSGAQSGAQPEIKPETRSPARQPEPGPVREVSIREEGIRLGQFLKLADLIDNGAEAKPLLAEGRVSVNGETETRRGRQLVKGDVVTLGEVSARVL